MQLVSNSNPTVLFILEHHGAWLFHQNLKVLRFFLLPFLHLFNWENFIYFWLKVLLFIHNSKSLQGGFIFQWCFRLWFGYLASQYSLPFFPDALNGLLWCPPHIPSVNPSWIFDLHTMQQFTSGSELNGIH